MPPNPPESGQSTNVLLDVNVVVALLVSTHPHHSAVRLWWSSRPRPRHSVLIPEEVCASFVRLAASETHFPTFGGLDEAITSVRRFAASSLTRVVYPSTERIGRALELAKNLRLGPKGVPDAFLAAFAIERGATLVTFDRGFSRFPGLSVELLRG